MEVNKEDFIGGFTVLSKLTDAEVSDVTSPPADDALSEVDACGGTLSRAPEPHVKDATDAKSVTNNRRNRVILITVLLILMNIVFYEPVFLSNLQKTIASCSIAFIYILIEFFIFR